MTSTLQSGRVIRRRESAYCSFRLRDRSCPVKPKCRKQLRPGGGLAMVAVLTLGACAGFEERAAMELASKPDARILVIGDSVTWWNAAQGESIADAIAADLGEPVVNLSVPGAAVSHPDPDMAAEGLDIRAQYRGRGWDWVVVGGGANDLGDEGPERGCATVLDELVSADGRRGEVPDLVGRIRSDGARVVALGYYALSAHADEAGLCGGTLSDLSGRIETMASLDPGILFVAMADVVSPANPATYDRDGIHPSALSSQAIGQRIADVIRTAERR